MLKHTKYIATLMTTFLLCVLIYIGVIYYQLGVPTPSSYSMDEFLRQKEELSANIPNPRLVFVSGSSGRVGISCSLIKNKLSINCFNGGTSLNSPLESMLSRAQNWLISGDIAILPLEYSLYYSDVTVNREFIDYTLARNPIYLNQASLGLRIKLIFGAPFQRIWNAVKIKILDQTPSIPEGYRRRPMNEYGDDIDNLEANLTEEMIQQRKSFSPVIPSLKSLSLKRDVIAIKKFVRWCQLNNITVLMSWPNTMWFKSYSGENVQDFFREIKEFYFNLEVPILGEPEDFMYPEDMFYDSVYHLHDHATQTRTAQLIQLLKPHLLTFSRGKRSNTVVFNLLGE
jgi:hypothetical protein